MLLSKIRETNHKKRLIIKRITPSFCFFENGLYLIDCSSKIISKFNSLNQYRVERKHTLNGAKSTKKHKFFRSFFDKRIICIKRKGNNDNGFTTCILSYDHLIFLNPKIERVLTVYDNNLKRNAVLKRRNTLLNEGFNLPEQLKDRKPTKHIFLEERYIQKREYNPENGLMTILDFYLKKEINNCSDTKQSYFKALISYLKNNNSSLIEELKDFLSKNDFKHIICHGDCNYFNYIFNDKSFFFIDYDRAGMHLFFCDSIFYIFWQYYVLHDSTLISNYFNGHYDSLFESLFNRFNIKFDSNKRYIYILLTIYDISSGKIDEKMVGVLERFMNKNV